MGPAAKRLRFGRQAQSSASLLIHRVLEALHKMFSPLQCENVCPICKESSVLGATGIPIAFTQIENDSIWYSVDLVLILRHVFDSIPKADPATDLQLPKWRSEQQLGPLFELGRELLLQEL